MQSSPVETIHRQVGNQAVQSGYAEEEYSEPAGNGSTRVAGWQSVTIPGKSVAPGATGAAGQQVSGGREIERVKNRLWTQFESIIDDTLR